MIIYTHIQAQFPIFKYTYNAINPLGAINVKKKSTQKGTQFNGIEPNMYVKKSVNLGNNKPKIKNVVDISIYLFIPFLNKI